MRPVLHLREPPVGTVDGLAGRGREVHRCRCAESDLLPDPDSTDRQGWWGDLDAEEIWGGWPIGSKLWLLRRSKIEGPNAQRGSTIALVKSYVIQALQAFIDRRICTRFDVEVTRVDTQRVDTLVLIYRGPTRWIELRYAILWEEQSTVYMPRTER